MGLLDVVGSGLNVDSVVVLGLGEDGVWTVLVVPRHQTLHGIYRPSYKSWYKRIILLRLYTSW